MKRISFFFILSQFVIIAFAQPLRTVSQNIGWEQLIGKTLVLSRYGILARGNHGQWHSYGLMENSDINIMDNVCFGQQYTFTNPAKDKPVEQFVLKDATHFVWQYSLNGDFQRVCKICGKDLILTEELFGNKCFHIIYSKDEVIYTLGDDKITRVFYIYNSNPSPEMLPISYYSKNGFCNGELDDLLPYATDNTYLKDFPLGRHYFNARRLTPEMEKYLTQPALADLPNQTENKAFDVVLYPQGKPVVTDVNQNACGDCNFMSVLADMAFLYPDFIKSIITKEKDGTFRVKMFAPDGKRITVAVSNKFPVHNGNFYYCSTADGQPNWATVLEVAAIKYIAAYQMIGGVQGCNAEMMTPMFTGDGRSFCIQPSKLSQADLTRMITICLKNGIMVNGGFQKGQMELDHHTTISDHGHTFLLSGREDALFAIRNPWGRSTNSYIMHVTKEDSKVTDVIDIRIISPGAAAQYFKPTELKPIPAIMLTMMN